jgi:hypothetical protein
MYATLNRSLQTQRSRKMLGVLSLCQMDETIFSHAERIDDLKKALYKTFPQRGAQALEGLIRENLQIARGEYSRELQSGVTKFGGPADVVLPEIEFLGRDESISSICDYLYRIEDKTFYFLGQFNLEYLQQSLPNELFPKNGLLLFFIEKTHYDPCTRVFYNISPQYEVKKSEGCPAEFIKGLSLPSF